jgi:hypothetical protein
VGSATVCGTRKIPPVIFGVPTNVFFDSVCAVGVVGAVMVIFS